MKVRARGLLVQMFALVIIPFTVQATAVAFLGIRVHERALRSVVADHDRRLARAAAAAVSGEVRRRMAIVHSIALRLKAGQSPSEAMSEAAQAGGAFDAGLAVLNKNGVIVGGSLKKELLPPGMLSEIRKSREPRISLPLPGGGERLALALDSAGVYTIAGAFAISRLLQAGRPETGAAEAPFYILDLSAQPLASTAGPDDPDSPGRRAAFDAAVRGDAGITSFLSAKGEQLLSFSPIGSTGWVLAVEEPARSVRSSLVRLSFVGHLALVPALAISLLALWFGMRQVVRPLQKVKEQAMRFAAGEFTPPVEEVGGIDEIRQLARGLTLVALRIQSAQQALKQYIGKVTAAHEDERRRLSRDLHDETIQDLIALDQKVQMIALNLGAGEWLDPQTIHGLHQEAQKVIHRVRRLSRGLRPIYLEELGLVPALEALAKDSEASLGIPVTFRVGGSPPRLPQEAELALYRIAQEALTNVGRHARARHVWIELTGPEGSLRLSVRDDGIGFSPPSKASDLARSGHFGLIGMTERAQSVGARLDISSAAGKGTLLLLLMEKDRHPAG